MRDDSLLYQFIQGVTVCLGYAEVLQILGFFYRLRWLPDNVALGILLVIIGASSLVWWLWKTHTGASDRRAYYLLAAGIAGIFWGSLA